MKYTSGSGAIERRTTSIVLYQRPSAINARFALVNEARVERGSGGSPASQRTLELSYAVWRSSTRSIKQKIRPNYKHIK